MKCAVSSSTSPRLFADTRSGYLTQVTEGFGTSVASTRTFAYDTLHRLTQNATPTETATYTYDALRRLSSVTFPNAKTAVFISEWGFRLEFREGVPYNTPDRWMPQPRSKRRNRS